MREGRGSDRGADTGPPTARMTGREAAGAVEFRVLGPLEVRRDQTTVSLAGPRQRTLLVALLVEAGRVVSVDALAGTLWGDRAPADPRNAIQTAVARLRDVLGDDAPLVTRSPGYALEVDADQVDAQRFERLLTEARGHDRPAEVCARLEEALGLWRGPAYAGFADGVARAEALRLDEARLTAVEELAAARLALGAAAPLVGELEAAVTEHPLRERLVGLHMRALAIADRTAEALAAYRAYRHRLAEETGLEPSPAIRDLEGRILRGELTRRGAPTAPGRRTGGRPAAPARTPTVPVPPTSLVGRDREIAEVRDALDRQRPVTITGTGGVGKTRVAAEVAHAAQREASGEVAWVELAPVMDPAALEHVVASALEIDLGTSRAPRRSLLEALATRALLLVLDNAEHLLDPVAPLVDEVRRHAPDVRLLVTSRERLAVTAERVVGLAPLPTRGGDQGSADAVRLFLDRAEDATGHRPTDQLPAVTEICHHLDGLPLAIELAAARTAALAPRDLLVALREDATDAIGHRRSRPARHRDLWSVVDWSYRLLEEDERLLFDRLAVFAGAFGVDEAHEVCAPPDWRRGDTVGRLATLAERSLVDGPTTGWPAGDAGRYRLLRPLRAFARQRLADRGELTSITDRLIVAYTARAERAAGPPLTDAGRQWLEGALDDLREVRRRAMMTRDVARLSRLVAALYRFDYWRPGTELLAWGEDALALDGIEDGPLAPQVHAAAAAAAWTRGDLERARRLAEHGTTLGTGPDDPARALAFEALGDTAAFDGRLRDAERAFREAARLARSGGDPDAEVVGQTGAALVLAYGGEVDRPVREARAARDLARGAGPAAEAFAHYALGECLAETDPERAVRLADEAIDLARACDAWFVEGVARVTAASLRARHGEPGAAVSAFAELVRHWHRSGNRPQQWTALRNLVELLVRLGADEPAVVIAAAGEVQETAVPTFGTESDRLSDAVRTARQRLGTDRFEAARSRGRRLSAREVVELALTTLDEVR
jgi:predicted ATPase/DNA-binding SARP family transcriptional activator